MYYIEHTMDIRQFFKENNRKLIALLLCLYGLYLRFKLYTQRELNTDELNQLNYTTSDHILPFWNKYTAAELTAFPGDYLLTLPFIKVLGTSKWAIAVPHIIVTVIGFYFLYLICARYLKTALAWVITFSILALNSTLQYHSFELRPYAVLPTLYLAVFYFSETIVCNYQQTSRSKKFLIGLFFVLVVVYHAYGIMMIALCLFYFILSESKDRPFISSLRLIAPFAIGFSLIALPLFLWYATRISDAYDYEAFVARNLNTFDYIPNPLTALNNFFRSVFNYLMGYKKIKFLINGIILCLLIPHPERFKQIGFFLVLIILPLECILSADVHTGYWFVQRQFIWIVPLYAFFIGWCWDSIFQSAVKFCKQKFHQPGIRSQK